MRLKFSLRFLLLGVAIISAGVAVVVRLEQRRRLVGVIEAAGGECAFYGSRDQNIGLLRKILPAAYVCEVEEVVLHDSTTNLGTVLPRLCEFRLLSSLHLISVPQLSDSHLDSLVNLKSLRKLNLNRNSQLTDAGAARIAKVKTIEVLWLAETGVGDDALADLSRLERLSELILNNTQISDAGLQHLTSMQFLEYLGLDGTSIGNLGAKHLANIDSLKTLSMRGTKIDDAGVRYLSMCENLEVVSLDNTGIGDAGIAFLSALRQLKTLSLRNSRVGDAGVAHLSKLHFLERLYLDGTSVSDASVEQLAALDSLQRLHLFRTQISPSGRLKIAESLPNCELSPK